MHAFESIVHVAVMQRVHAEAVRWSHVRQWTMCSMGINKGKEIIKMNMIQHDDQPLLFAPVHCRT